jgi:hypothetical protein
MVVAYAAVRSTPPVRRSTEFLASFVPADIKRWTAPITAGGGIGG